jgi:diguanylate cyclase (GGDEF)-like protein/PAS domain S-box-containing protein
MEVETLEGRAVLSAPNASALLRDAVARETSDRLTRLAGLALRAPVATLAYVDGDRLRLLSQVGLPDRWAQAGSLPLSSTFDQFVHGGSDVMVVEDASRHPLGYSVPRPEGFPRVSYCGAPVQVDGVTIAVLSVSDYHARRWSAEDVTVIRDLAETLVRDLEALALRPVTFERETLLAAASLDALPDGLLIVDSNWRFIFANAHAQQLLARDESALVGHSFWEIFPGLAGSVFQAECLRVIHDAVAVDLEEYCHSLRRWLELRASPTAEGGAAIHVRDISKRRRAHEELRGREARYRRLFEESHTPLFVMAADSRLLEVNQAFERLLGRSRDELYRMRMCDLAVNRAAFDRVLHELRVDGAVSEAELTLQRRETPVVCVLSGSMQVTDGIATYHGALRDVTAYKKTQEELMRSALHDALTGLPNRVVFMDRLERLLKHAKRRTGTRFAVLFLDLDNFKIVNDTWGHIAGDQLLVAVARRLESCVRQEDTVARIGGDEFAVLLDTINDAGSVTAVVERIRESLSQPYDNTRGGFGITASIGIAISMSGYERADDLLHDADTAMYRAKQGGRNAYVMFDLEMQQRATQQRQLEKELRGAMARDQLAVHYHPVVELERGAVTGLEALLRWAHPERGILLPSDFMPLAERTGLIVEIGWWVLREACRQLKAWQNEYPDAAFSLSMSVNLSAKQFVHPGLVTTIDEILRDTQLDPRCLRLDLTEAVMMRDSQVTVELVRKLRARGIQICIDDFGTGFTSLRQLRDMKISMLKIDRSLIDQLHPGGEGREIVQTIVALGRSMAIDAVAEGVETPEQLDQLRNLGLRFAQGFLFSLPLDRGATARLLEQAH